MKEEPTPYYQAARFPNKNSTGKAYDPIQTIIFEEECDLSGYRFFERNQRKWYVVVIGEKPSPQVHQRIETILHTLTRGERVPLDSKTLAALLARRAQQIKLGPWVEHHYHVPDQQEWDQLMSPASTPSTENKHYLCSHLGWRDFFTTQIPALFSWERWQESSVHTFRN